MKVKELCSYLDSAVPLSFQEGYDNSGLQVGDPEKELSLAMISLDVTGEVLDEAINTGCGMIISHHPPIFSGILKLTGRSASERIIIKALRHDIAIYSAHTNLDVYKDGVSRKMAEKLGLDNVKVLTPMKNRLMKLITFVPGAQLEIVRRSVFNAGAGVTGNYDQCSFSTTGTGSFRGNKKANPFVGERGKLHFEKEIRFETIFPSHLKDDVINALLLSHPYEEVAFDIIKLENDYYSAGMGCTGELPVEMGKEAFLDLVSSVFSPGCLRYSGYNVSKIRKVSVCGGSGGGLLADAINSGSEAFITADVRYHSYFEAAGRILLIDAGHFETEKFAQEILYDLINKKFPKFALRFSQTNSNPINYY
jgi:dinuclear metal center YbgI/SA1388 family protein